MSELLNAAQRSSLTIGLRSFEMHLRQADAWLRDGEERGILYSRSLNVSPERRAVARAQIRVTLQRIADLAEQFDLPVAEESLPAAIAGQMSVDWANLCDVASAKMQRYGDVHPGLAEMLDAHVYALAQQALSLAALGQDP